MPWRAQLVVLSACNTRRWYDGATPDGFCTALRCGGVRTVIATIWETPDRTAPRFMERFYRAVARGLTIPAALREVKLEMIGDQVTPLDWGQFVVYGAGGSLPWPSSLESPGNWTAASVWVVLVYSLAWASCLVISRRGLRGKMLRNQFSRHLERKRDQRE